jgi:hypothetical protein
MCGACRREGENDLRITMARCPLILPDIPLATMSIPIPQEQTKFLPSTFPSLSKFRHLSFSQWLLNSPLGETWPKEMGGIEDYHSDGQMLLTTLFTSQAPGRLGMIRHVGHRSCQAIFVMNLASGRPERGKRMNGFGYIIPDRVLTQEALGENKYYFRLVGLEMDWNAFVTMFFLERKRWTMRTSRV